MGFYAMKRLISSLLTALAAAGPSLVAAQHADLNSLAGHPIQPFTVAAPQGGGCDAATPGIIIHDDNQAENGYGWQPTVTDGRFAELFTPPAYPANFTSVCFSLITNAGVTSLPFDIVEGLDGVLPGEEPVTQAHGATTFEAGLRLLDTRGTWTLLHPIRVNPEYAARTLAAVEARLGNCEIGRQQSAEAMERWCTLCERRS